MGITKVEFKGEVLYVNGIKATQSSTPHTSGHTNLTNGLVVLHYTASDSMSGTLEWFRDPRSKVSAHFVIGQNGQIVQVLSPMKIGWHAGKSEWHLDDGRYINGVNSISVGIEMVKENGKPPWPMAQVVSCVMLVRAIHGAFGTKEVVGHDDVAPGRKFDPGKDFWTYWEKAVAEIDAAVPEQPKPIEPKKPVAESVEKTIQCPHCGEDVVLYVTAGEIEVAEYE